MGETLGREPGLHCLKAFGVIDREVELIVQENLWALGRRWRENGARRMWCAGAIEEAASGLEEGSEGLCDGGSAG